MCYSLIHRREAHWAGLALGFITRKEDQKETQSLWGLNSLETPLKEAMDMKLGAVFGRDCESKA